MEEVASLSLLLAASLALIGFTAFAVVSAGESERRAARVALLFALLFSIPVMIAALLPSPVPAVGAGIMAIVLVVASIALLVPSSARPPLGGRPSQRVDERDILFARGRLREGSPEYGLYYAMRPEAKHGDDLTRSLPGLLSGDARLAEPMSFAAAEASFDLTEAMRDHVDGEVAHRRIERSSGFWSEKIKDLARSYGAVDVGVAELRPHHVYTHIGRGTGGYGEEIELKHRWAVAFTVEMDHGRVRQAPNAPVVEESARQYVEAAKIALILASWIRRLGYPARAHTDGNYRVIAPLVARDAGLGEIGRMGLTMTPRHGPRVRLGVVTTDLPLVADDPGDDPSVIDFCLNCRKCADNCPVSAIPAGDRTPIDNGLRWAIDADTCYRYWNVIGTDCASCMRVCPYSHPDNIAHNVVRAVVRRSAVARRAMLLLDDLFYGKHPPSIDNIER